MSADVDTLYEKCFLFEARNLGLFGATNHVGVINTKFNSWFGTSAFVCSKIWKHILLLGPLKRGCYPKRLLWCLMFMKSYPHEHIISVVLKTTEKTARKWIWYIVELIASISEKVVSYSISIIIL